MHSQLKLVNNDKLFYNVKFLNIGNHFVVCRYFYILIIIINVYCKNTDNFRVLKFITVWPCFAL